MLKTLQQNASWNKNQKLILIFCDVDNFKHYNDRNGHPAGDEVLKGVAEVLRTNPRNTDFAARYGGEEFVVLCPQTPLESALVLAERIRENIANKPFPFMEFQPLKKISISIGVATYPFDGKTSDEVLKSADEALYNSKTNGRNQVTSSYQLKEKKNAA
ncbi:MAG: GGDEF domain-containing protein [Deltaproteobacteria bacterium]|nr:GGDEF domain-containing protein [Deltaproteobacteria bacterium]